MNSQRLDKIENLLAALTDNPTGQTEWKPWAPRQAEIAAEYDSIVGDAPQAQHAELLDAHFRRCGVPVEEIQAARERTDAGDDPFEFQWRPKGDRHGQLFYRTRAS